MGNAKDGSTLELFAYESLDGLLSNDVNVGGSFVEDDYLVAAEDSSNNADELTFTDTQILSFFLDFKIEALIIISLLFIILFDLRFLLFGVFLYLIFIVCSRISIR